MTVLAHPQVTSSLYCSTKKIGEGNMKKLLWVGIISVFFIRGVYAFPQMTAVVPARNEVPAEFFSFTVVGDSQPKGVFGQPEVFKKIIREINKSGAEFTVHMGDKISGHRDTEVVRKKYREYFKVIEELKAPVYHTVGNHDITGLRGNEEIHKELFGPLYYSFTHKNCLFLILNTESAGSEGAITGEQLLWLKDELEKGKGCKYIFVFLHRPLFSALYQNKSYSHFRSEEHRNEIAELFKKYGVSVVFAGHEHLYHSGRYDGLLQVISGGGGGRFHFYPAGNFHHYLLIEVTQKTAAIRVIPVN